MAEGMTIKSEGQIKAKGHPANTLRVWYYLISHADQENDCT